MKNRLFQNMTLILIVSIISKFIGFLRDIFQANALGTSQANDAYFFAYSITYVILQIIMVSVNSTFIPLVTENIKKNPEDASDTINIFITFYTMIGFLLYLVIYFSAPYISETLLKSFSHEYMLISIKLIRLIGTSVLLIGSITIISGLYQIKDKFFLPALNGFFPSILIILSSIIFIYPVNLYAISISNTIGRVIYLLVLIIVFLLKYKTKFTFTFKFNNQYLKKSLILLLPVLIGTIFQQIDILVVRLFASSLPEGSISAYSYASTITLTGVGIVGYAISTVLYPNLSKLFLDNKINEFSNSIASFIILIFILFIPISVFLLFYSNKAIEILYQRGEFDSYSTLITAASLSLLAFSLFPLTAREILNKAFYSTKDTLSPILASLVSIILNISLCYIVVNVYGLKGISMVYTFTSWVLVLLLIISLYRKKVLLFSKDAISDILKITFANLIMFSILVFTKMNINIFSVITNSIASFFIFGIIFVIIYSIIVYLLKISVIVKMVKILGGNNV